MPEERSKITSIIMWVWVGGEEQWFISQIHTGINTTSFSGPAHINPLQWFLHSRVHGTFPTYQWVSNFFYEYIWSTWFLPFHPTEGIVRAHECMSDGYKLNGAKNLYTIFSAARYCNENNKAAMLTVCSTTFTNTILKSIFPHHNRLKR
jgi:hypothetical protein